jgi:hypothetical protein
MLARRLRPLGFPRLMLFLVSLECAPRSRAFPQIARPEAELFSVYAASVPGRVSSDLRRSFNPAAAQEPYRFAPVAPG